MNERKKAGLPCALHHLALVAVIHKSEALYGAEIEGSLVVNTLIRGLRGLVDPRSPPSPARGLLSDLKLAV